MVRSVEVGLDSEFEVIVSTSNDSWAERDLEVWRETGTAALGENDLAGPVPIAVAGYVTPRGAEGDGGEDGSEAEGDRPTGARLVVFGDSDFMSNEFIENFRNRDLFLNSVTWLMGDIAKISVRPNVAAATRFQLSADQFQRIQYLSLFLLPETIAVIGVLAWWFRREQPET
jgi:hypothetical protein